MKKQRFALTTFIGLVGGITCVALSISQSGNFKIFINIPSLLIIVGGTAFALIMSYPFSTLKTLGSVIKQAFTYDEYDLIKDIDTIVELSEISRKEGLLALENYMDKTDDQFLKKGLQLLIDGVDREYLESIMLGEIYRSHKRHRTGASMISMIASVAPGLGLVGTYVGLIPMLVNVTDPDKLGPLMAVELVSSFYGGFMANVIFSPMAKKLINKSEHEKERNQLILEGILSIHEGKNPRLIREELLSFLTKREIKKAYKGNEVNKVYRDKETSYNGNSDGKVVNYRKRKGV